MPPIPSMHSYNYKLDPVLHPHHIITVNTNWRRLPVLLDCIRSIPLDIRRAHISEEGSTFYLKEPSVLLRDRDITSELSRLAESSSSGELIHRAYGRMRLPLDTQILLYNIPSKPYTTMEFGCNDRIGLLCDLLMFLEPLSVELKESHVTTVGTFAHNILHLTKNGRSLNDPEITYIRNVFEHEAKERIQPGHDLM